MKTQLLGSLLKEYILSNQMRTGSGKAKDDTVDLEGIGLNIFKINCMTFKKIIQMFVI